MWNPRNLGYKFLAEAKRLWELEISQNKLTTIQAAGILNLIYNVDGVDKIGLTYLEEAVRMAKVVGLFSGASKLKSQGSDVAREFTAWSLFNWETSVPYHGSTLISN